jgi:short subunit dehydrogenase-like uncharacterized protein
MSYNILLYGATGFSGRLVAAEGKAMGMSRQNARGDCRMILAARDGAPLRAVAEENGMEFRVFGLDHRNEILRQLDGIDVVINAAGPFALTAESLAKAALQKRCHYVDINGEVDVYRMLDDLGFIAAQRGVAIVSGAGNSAAASDVLLDLALRELSSDNKVKEAELGAVRIAVSQIMDFSRGSAATVMRYLREQVVVIRKKQSLDRDSKMIDQLVICHEPIGKLERTFDFGHLPDKREDQKKENDLRIASAANLIDTLTAQHTVRRNKLMVRTIESYIEMGALSRIAYQLGGMLSSFSTLPWVPALTKTQLSLLPEGPTQQELEMEKHVVLIEIEDVYHKRLIDWRWETPNVYQFTAQLVVEIARNVAEGKKLGWLTPADALGSTSTQELSEDTSRPVHPFFRGCKLEKRELEQRKT